MRLADLVQLGRVSNLPTVWSNVLAATVLIGAPLQDPRLPMLLLAMSLLYVGGMALNDAFDAVYDARHRPERPIPSGHLRRRLVFALGFGCLVSGALLLVSVGALGAVVLEAGWGALALAVTIVWYDWRHKGTGYAPLLMGLARFLVYLGTALGYSGSAPTPLLLGALALMSYVIGLTYIARQENLQRLQQVWPLGLLLAVSLYLIWIGRGEPWVWLLWLAWTLWVLSALKLLIRPGAGDIPRAVARLIAGIALLDAVLIASAGRPSIAGLALLCFGATLMLQRRIAAT